MHDGDIILFVDWDGVLNTPDLSLIVPDSLQKEFHQQEKRTSLSPIAVGLLNQLCSKHENIRIVCSSTWRLGSTKDEIIDTLMQAHNRLEDMMRLQNIPFTIGFYDKTNKGWRTENNYDYDCPRGKAIDKWLKDFGEENQKYLIIDDDKDFYPWQKPYLIRTNDIRGLDSNTFLKLEDAILFEHENPIIQQLNLDF